MDNYSGDKFRAWDNQLKRMYYNYAIVSGYGVHTEFTRPVESADEQLIVMQYTKHKDKNNKEIFRGDIVGIYSPNFGIVHRGVVEQSPSGEWYTTYLKGDHPAYRKDNYANDKQQIRLIDITQDGDTNRAVVIGNIYDNPDLLPEPLR
jgi:uncharacterized phage protein (TIGR01671 family)